MKLRYLILGLLIAVLFSGCKVWDDEWKECFPLPEVDVPVTTDPWEPPVSGEKELGE